MPRRTATPATPAPPPPLPPPPRDLLLLHESDPQWAQNLRILRQHWKWANFSQFFYTFAPLLAMPDLFLPDLEDDLARGTSLYLPRIIHRLLYTLSQDRKLNIDNWQSALRRQYLRRDPDANPIGPEPKLPSRDSSLTPDDDDDDQHMSTDHQESESEPNLPDTPNHPSTQSAAPSPKHPPDSNPKLEPVEDVKVLINGHALKPEDHQESKDWLELPMLDKLDSLHLLTQWQFHNSHRVRQLMKDDDESANWRIEPIGYDAKTNAYWLIGTDRLWIQRAPPKPPRTLKRKRPSSSPKKPARSQAVALSSSSDEAEEPSARPKRTRTQSQSARTRSQPQTNGRATRGSRRAAHNSTPPAESPVTSGKSTRAAKVQANKKLDMQAKELAEFQRQAAALASAKSRSSPRKSRGAAPASPTKRAVGTRVSARLRTSTRAGGGEDHGDYDDDDGDGEWQQVPEEWLQERATPEPRTSSRRRGKGKAKVQRAEQDDESEGEADANPETDAGDGLEGAGDGDEPGSGADVEPGAEEGPGAEDGREAAAESDTVPEHDDHGDKPVAEDVAEGLMVDDNAKTANKGELLQKAGLESGSVSDLTDLTEAEEDDDETEEPRNRRRQNTRKSVVRKSARQTRRQTVSFDPKPSRSKAKLDPRSEAEEDYPDEPPAPPLPEGFVEWEAIAITLSEWEHVADPFEKATHYLEKALYKMLTQNIIPVVTAELKEAEKRKRIEEAVVRRKRSSRIALKESEKEEARQAAVKKEEDDRKYGRERRQEARRKKEEDERTRRENAREQRRKDREEREARAQAKAEREEAAAARSTATPSINDTQPSSSSLLPSRVVTPSGVRTPDWMLDCEICHKHGLNMDDGKAMVSCGSCNRWQHIVCHDLHDQRTGRPRRDWDKQQFYCARCRQRTLNGSSFAHSGYPLQHQPQYSWQQQQQQQQQSGRPIHLHKPGGVDPFAHTSELRYSQRSPVENGVGYQQYMPNSPMGTSYQRSSYSNVGSSSSFGQYQQEQRGQPLTLSTTPQAWGSGGYPSGSERERMGTSQYSPPYGSNGGSMYSGSRVSAFQTSPTGHSSFGGSTDVGVGAGLPSSNTRWTQSTANGHHSPQATNGYYSPSSAALHEAAQSLTSMHDGGHGRYNNSNGSWPAASYEQRLPQSHHQSAYPAPPAGVDPLTGRSFTTTPRVDHIGQSLSHSSSASSFNFPP